MSPSVARVCPLGGDHRWHALVAKVFPVGQRLLGGKRCGPVRLLGETPFRPDYWEDDGAGVHVYEAGRQQAASTPATS